MTDDFQPQNLFKFIHDFVWLLIFIKNKIKVIITTTYYIVYIQMMWLFIIVIVVVENFHVEI